MDIRAFIVDDSSVMRKMAGRSLRQPGFELRKTFEACNSAEALSVFGENQVDLILCDTNVPIMDGLEFIKQLPGVANAMNVPPVVITTEGSEALMCVRPCSSAPAAISASHSPRPGVRTCPARAVR
ncbi:MAG: response regulator [Terriglobales bacterium]